MATFYSSHSLCLPISDRCPCCHIPRNTVTFTAAPKYIKSPLGSSGVSVYLFLVSLYTWVWWVPQSFLCCLSAESKDFYNTILNFQAFSIDFLFLWNLPFEFTSTRLFLGSACILFLLLLSTTGCRTESHCRQDYLLVPPLLLLLSPQSVNLSTPQHPPTLMAQPQSCLFGQFLPLFSWRGLIFPSVNSPVRAQRFMAQQVTSCHILPLLLGPSLE